MGERVIFLGSKGLGLNVLRSMWALSRHTLVAAITIDDVSDTRSCLAEIQRFCSQNGIALQLAADRKDMARQVRELRPDLCIVVGWYWLISPDLLQSVRGGFVGIHNSLLPAYRGGAPLVWQILNGESHVGSTIFSLTPGIDDGPVWAQARVPVGDRDSIAEVQMNLEEKVLEVFSDTYPRILDGTGSAREQRHDLATYCAQRLPDDGCIDWTRSAQNVYNFIRAQSDPYPGAFTWLDGERLHIWAAEPFEPIYFGTPGQVARVADDGVYVVCGDHAAIRLTVVGIGPVRGPARELVRSVKTRLASR